MTTERGDVDERRLRTQEMVDKWLEERRQMLVLFCQLAGLEPYTPDKPVKNLLSEFCQVLVDYMAFGHFEVYERITRGEERRGNVKKIAEELYPRLTEITDLAVSFNDKYDISDHPQSLDSLDKDLSRLGEELAVRFEIEDQLVEALMR